MDTIPSCVYVGVYTIHCIELTLKYFLSCLQFGGYGSKGTKMKVLCERKCLDDLTDYQLLINQVFDHIEYLEYTRCIVHLHICPLLCL